MKKLLKYCVKDNHFLFDDKCYDQIGGVSMGSSLGPILANIFMLNFEEKYLSDFDGNSPLYYKRYVDDTFLIFNDRDDCELFCEYFNTKHPNIKFTLEIENNNTLAFLDVLVSRLEDGTITTSLYRKPTFSGLHMKFDSFVPHQYKINLITGLLNRAWKICSTFDLFKLEIEFIKQLLMSNGYPLKFLNGQIRKFLNKKHNVEMKIPNYGPERKCIFISLPFCGQNSSKLNRQMARIVNKIAPWAKLNMTFKSSSRLAQLSKLKSVVSKLNKSNVIYKVNCNDCNEFYIGLTRRRLNVRLDEHSKRHYSALYKHSSGTGHSINYQDPEIISTDNVKIRLQIKETLQIQNYSANKSLNVNIDSFECKLW